MMALQALSTAEIKVGGSRALRGAFDLSEAETLRDISDEDLREVGGTHEDHFQPGVSAGSSKRERIKFLVCSSSGKRRSVIENPGMFRLVFSTVDSQLTG